MICQHQATHLPCLQWIPRYQGVEQRSIWCNTWIFPICKLLLNIVNCLPFPKIFGLQSRKYYSLGRYIKSMFISLYACIIIEDLMILDTLYSQHHSLIHPKKTSRPCAPAAGMGFAWKELLGCWQVPSGWTSPVSARGSWGRKSQQPWGRRWGSADAQASEDSYEPALDPRHLGWCWGWRCKP